MKKLIVDLGVRLVDGDTSYWLDRISGVPAALCPRMTMKLIHDEQGSFWEIAIIRKAA
jgi:hypothetical protein